MKKSWPSACVLTQSSTQFTSTNPGSIPIQADNLTELKTSEKKLIQKWSVAQTKKKFIERRKVLTKKTPLIDIDGIGETSRK